MGLHRERTVTAAVLLLLVGAGISVAATRRERSDAVYPPQRIPLEFSHKTHLDDGNDATDDNNSDNCDACHADARVSQKADDQLIPVLLDAKEWKVGEKPPVHETCSVCHDIDKAAEGKTVDPKSDCNTCHKGFDATAHKTVARASWPKSNVLFNHKVHVDKNVPCVTCHQSSVDGKMTEVGLATRYQLPKMDTCLTCHDGATASAECSTCHIRTDKGGRLQVNFSSGLLRPIQGDPFGIDHGPRYELTHGVRAKMERKLCLECHSESSCASCHDSLQKPLSVHPNDFITLHPVQARMDSLQCDSCHRFQSFCAACHERTGVGLDSDKSFRPRNLRVHPNYDEWVNQITSPKHHAIQASRDIKQCLSCHREESCTTCHATSAAGGRGLNPHPSGFQAGCKAMAARNDRACLKCHIDPDLRARGCK